MKPKLTQSLCYSLDWVQFTADYKYFKTLNNSDGKIEIDEESIVIESTKYEVEKQDTKTFHFKNQYKISFEGHEIATIQTVPHVSFLKKNLVQVKLSNRLLYYEQYYSIMCDLCSTFHLTFKNFNRLDIAIDFNSISTCFSIDKFIANISNNVFVSKSRKNVDIKLQGRKYNAITFGSRSSNVRVQLYNKSLEMRQKKDKHYIREYWNLNNISDEHTDVWRLEFSLKNDKKSNFLEVDNDGEVLEEFNFKNIEIILRDNINAIYNKVYNTHFQFAKTEKKNPKKQFCRLKKVNLLYELPQQKQLVPYFNFQKDSTSYVKGLVNNKIKYIKEYIDKNMFIQAYYIAKHVNNLFEEYNLYRWAKKNKLKKTDIILHDYISNIIEEYQQTYLSQRFELWD
jgi:hypothetical protein